MPRLRKQSDEQRRRKGIEATKKFREQHPEYYKEKIRQRLAVLRKNEEYRHQERLKDKEYQRRLRYCKKEKEKKEIAKALPKEKVGKRAKTVKRKRRGKTKEKALEKGELKGRTKRKTLGKANTKEKPQKKVKRVAKRKTVKEEDKVNIRKRLKAGNNIQLTQTQLPENCCILVQNQNDITYCNLRESICNAKDDFSKFESENRQDINLKNIQLRTQNNEGLDAKRLFQYNFPNNYNLLNGSIINKEPQSYHSQYEEVSELNNISSVIENLDTPTPPIEIYISTSDFFVPLPIKKK